MVTPALDYNPRRWKQFINLFRLKVQIATYTGLFSSVLSTSASSNQHLTLEQLGKFTAISVKWPRLLVDLNTDRQLLADLQKFALTEPLNFEEQGLKDTVKHWGSKQKLVELLRYPSDVKKSNTLKIEDKYSLVTVNTDILLQVASQDNLSSEAGVNYTKLRDFLAARNWKAADNETYLVMLQAVGREQGDWLRPEELLNFPCTDLHTIDRLWVKYSNGHFGFSVQKNIYLEVGGKPDGKYDDEPFLKFCDRVGWRVRQQLRDLPVNFGTSAQDGHLPSCIVKIQRKVESPLGVQIIQLGRNLVVVLFSRVQTCKL
ncbi:GUN4 domain-containing protein [Nostoc sp. FACHB-973]|nr:GUN4 domain-containing protein [Nostoc sp. FACHB-973]